MSPDSLPTSPEYQKPWERINIQVDEPYTADVDAEDLARAVFVALQLEGRPEGEVTVAVTGNEEVRALNRQFLDEDRPTDVLSFPTAGEPAESTQGGSLFVTAPEAAAYLGDIVIALPFARLQAQELGRNLADELRLLAVHGTLHLLGYDHAEPVEEAEMWARQGAILAQLAGT